MKMSITELGALGEFLGSIGVLLTMVYLAVQIRQNTSTIRMNAEQEKSKWWYSFNQELALDGELIEIFEQGLRDVTELTDPDRRRFVWFLAAMFYEMEGLHKQHQNGQLSEDSWKPGERLIRGMLQHRSVNQWWQSGFFLGGDAFIEYVESVRNSIDPSDWEWLDIARTFDASNIQPG